MKRAGVISALLIAFTFSRPGVPVEDPKVPEVHQLLLRVGLSEVALVREDLLRHLKEWQASSRIQLSEESLRELERILRSAQISAGSEQSAPLVMHHHPPGIWAISLDRGALGAPLNPIEAEARLLQALLEKAPPTREMEQLEEDFLEELQRHASWVTFRGHARRLALGVSSILESGSTFKDPLEHETGVAFDESAKHCQKTRKNRDCSDALEKFGLVHQRMEEDLGQRMAGLRVLEAQIARYRAGLLASVPGVNSRRVEALLREALDAHQALKRVLDLRESRTQHLQWAYSALEVCFGGKPKPFEQVSCLRSWTRQSVLALKQVLTGDQAPVVLKVSDLLTKIQNQAEFQ